MQPHKMVVVLFTTCNRWLVLQMHWVEDVKGIYTKSWEQENIELQQCKIKTNDK
jgi:hypothetical protein